MKIFNWVHRKFHNKDGWNVEVRKKKAEHDTHTLIEHEVDLSGVIDSWKLGILAIGTFGYDSLKDFTQLKQIQLIANNDQQELEEEEEEEEEEEDEPFSYVESSCDDEEEFDRDHNPLVLHAFNHAFNTATANASHSCDDQNESEIVFTVAGAAADDSNNYLAFDEKKKGKRITLADLFSADSDDYNTSTKPDHAGKLVHPEQIKKRPDEKHAKPPKLSFAKKLIPRVREDSDSHSRPIKKIHRMMTRMLKRKIHPELEGKNQNKENQMKHYSESINGANEMVSLLQTQDATVCA